MASKVRTLKMEKIFLLFLTVGISASLAATDPVASTVPEGCNGDPNAERKDCGSPCPRTCKNKDAGPIMCPFICIENGCDCKPGYVLDGINGTCIRSKDCPPIESCDGDPNAERRYCGNPCPRTCENKDAGPIPCTFFCIQNGCDCKPGYVLNNINGTCILSEDCPPVGCGGDPNAERKDCGNPCPRTCKNKDAGPIMCPFNCIENGCDCKPGYVLDGINGTCILSKDCPPIESCDGDPNAERRYCGNPCPRTCENKDAGPIPCTFFCIQNGCDCKPGYVLNNINGTCILSEDCPPVGCGGDPNAERKDCGNPCPRTCGNKDAGPIKCPFFCIENGCDCKPGYVLNHINGRCIPSENCPEHYCGPNEVYGDCKNPCPKTCDMITSHAPQPLCLPQLPCPGGCNCAEGYVRNKHHVCVAPAECPCPDPNAEVVECPNPCPRKCDNLATYSKTPCRKLCLLMGCTCKKGFVFNQHKMCIKPDKCRKPYKTTQKRKINQNTKKPVDIIPTK